MRILKSTLDQVEVSFIQAMLKEKGIEVLVMDENMSALYADNCLFPRRIMVADEDFHEAEAILKEIELEDTE